MTPHRLEIPRRSQEELREIVRMRLANEILFSDEVSPDLTGIVFMPLAMGALRPSEEVLVEVLGSASPPETLKGEPQKPSHPGYPETAGEPPPKPVLAKLPKNILSDIEWGYIPEEEREALLEKLREENQQRIRAWEEASMVWMERLDADTRARTEVDALYEESLRVWEESLSKHEADVAARNLLREEWSTKYKAFMSEWAEDLGVVFGNMKDTFPRAINGFPMFHSVSMVHKEDWTRIKTALIREMERSRELEV